MCGGRFAVVSYDTLFFAAAFGSLVVFFGGPLLCFCSLWSTMVDSAVGSLGCAYCATVCVQTDVSFVAWSAELD